MNVHHQSRCEGQGIVLKTHVLDTGFLQQAVDDCVELCTFAPGSNISTFHGPRRTAQATAISSATMMCCRRPSERMELAVVCKWPPPPQPGPGHGLAPPPPNVEPQAGAL